MPVWLGSPKMPVPVSGCWQKNPAVATKKIADSSFKDLMFPGRRYYPPSPLVSRISMIETLQ